MAAMEGSEAPPKAASLFKKKVKKPLKGPSLAAACAPPPKANRNIAEVAPVVRAVSYGASARRAADVDTQRPMSVDSLLSFLTRISSLEFPVFDSLRWRVL